MIARRFTETARPIRQAREAVPESVDQAIRRALAPAPADRFATAAEFGAALEAATDDRGAGGRRVTAPTRTAALPPKPRRPPVAALALVLGLLIGAGALFAWRRGHAGRGRRWRRPCRRGAPVREPGRLRGRLLRRRRGRRGADQADPGVGARGDRPGQLDPVPGDDEAPSRDRAGAGRGLPADRNGAVGEGRGRRRAGCG